MHSTTTEMTIAVTVQNLGTNSARVPDESKQALVPILPQASGPESWQSSCHCHGARSAPSFLPWIHPTAYFVRASPWPLQDSTRYQTTQNLCYGWAYAVARKVALSATTGGKGVDSLYFWEFVDLREDRKTSHAFGDHVSAVRSLPGWARNEDGDL